MQVVCLQTEPFQPLKPYVYFRQLTPGAPRGCDCTIYWDLFYDKYNTVIIIKKCDLGRLASIPGFPGAMSLHEAPLEDNRLDRILL